MKGRSVVVTGLGVVSPVGIGVVPFWQSVCAGRIGTRPVTRFSTDGLRSDRGGEIADLDPAPSFLALDPRGHQRTTQLSVVACREAIGDAGLGPGDLREVSERAGVVMGAVVANRPGLEARLRALYRGQAEPDGHIDAHEVAWVAEAPAIELGLSGGATVLPTACAAGNNAIAFGADWISRGDADLVLAGGADELSPAMFILFSAVGSLSPDVVRPFDRGRKGVILSEGAGALVLEAEEHARARGARIYGRVAGHGNYADAHDMTHPHPDGAGALLSMRAALAEAELDPRDIDYVSAHGTGTVANDGIEARAVRQLFGAHSDSLPVSSIKSMLGHTQGAASAIEAVACLLAMRDSIVPPTMNHEETDAGCPIDVVPNRARRHRVRAALNNGFGFGGNICCVVFTEA